VRRIHTRMFQNVSSWKLPTSGARIASSFRMLCTNSHSALVCALSKMDGYWPRAANESAYGMPERADR
jgi:hypothetical protein